MPPPPASRKRSPLGDAGGVRVEPCRHAGVGTSADLGKLLN